MFHSFQCTYLLPPWFSLFQSIVLFLMLLVSSLLMLSFKSEKFLILLKSNLSIFPLVPWVLMSYIRNGCLTQGYKDCFLLRCFMVWHLHLSLWTIWVHFYMWCEVQNPNSFFCLWIFSYSIKDIDILSILIIFY